MISALTALGVSVLIAMSAGVSDADTAPLAVDDPPTVSADALPTVQIDGVVWSQVTVGTTVYATGQFGTARPAGSPIGSNTVVRHNLLAYDIVTGDLDTSFVHDLNAPGLAITASPDGTRVYVAGNFTAVDGRKHERIAAFDTATASLVSSFAPSLNNVARALVATNQTVYVGGSFTGIGAAIRTRLAAFSRAGALLAWAPTADNLSVTAMTLSPNASTVVVAGHFTSLNRIATSGLGAVDATTGATRTFPAASLVINSGPNAAITSLHTVGSRIYGTAYGFASGKSLEGMFAADGNTGAPLWVEDCHGDSYDSFSTGGVAYVVTHAHDCATLGAWQQTNPLQSRRALAFTTDVRGVAGHPDPATSYRDYAGTPTPALLHWYPNLTPGTATGQNQAAWSITGNTDYIALGGEFTSVDGQAQQGLVRFAIRSLAPNRIGPGVTAGLTPHVVSQVAGTARVAWQATWDLDNENLTYQVIRDGQVGSPVFTTTIASNFWRRPAAGFLDQGLTPGSVHSYRVVVSDPLGNVAKGSTISVTVSAAVASQYVSDVLADGASHYWRLGIELPGVAEDRAGYADLTEGTGVSATAGAGLGDDDTAATFNGSSNSIASSSTAELPPDTFTLEAWFRTTTTLSGRIVGFSDGVGPLAGLHLDRHLYLDTAGRLRFGISDGTLSTVSSAGAYNDNQWHHVAVTFSVDDGTALYADGQLVAIDTSAGMPSSYWGFWRIASDRLTGWAGASGGNFAGSIDDVAVYPTQLSQRQIQRHYTDSGRTVRSRTVGLDRPGPIAGPPAGPRPTLR